MTDIAFSSAIALARAIRGGQIGSRELTLHYFERIDRLNAAINAVIAEDRERALERADAADAALARGDWWGPLHGVPMTVKESYNLAGFRTTWGVKEFERNYVTEDALAVQRLKAAGAIVFGKTNVPLRLADFQSYNEIYGTTGNPWDKDRTPGGSSGGSAAALAAGLTGFELGSDIGGSIRNPAHYCGVFGHKPTWNLLPPRGHALPGTYAPPDISVIGPLARAPEDLALALDLLAHPDEIAGRGLVVRLPPLEKPVSEMRVAVWADDPIAPVASDVRHRVERVAATLEAAGARVSHTARPEFSPADSHEAYQFLLQSTMASRMPDADYAALLQAAAQFDPDDRRPGVQTVRAQTLSFRDWSRWNHARYRMRLQWAAFFEHFDVLLTPMMATAAFLHDHRPASDRTIQVNGETRSYFEQIFWAGLPSVAFLPATVVPTGPNDAGLPIGVQIIGPEYGDRITIGLAERLAQMGYRFTPPPGH
jgi:amidase